MHCHLDVDLMSCLVPSALSHTALKVDVGHRGIVWGGGGIPGRGMGWRGDAYSYVGDYCEPGEGKQIHEGA